jgi:hypothetical protein
MKEEKDNKYDCDAMCIMNQCDIIGYVPRGRVKIQDSTSTVIYKTNNTSLLSVRNGLIRHTDQLVRQEGYDYQYDSE